MKLERERDAKERKSCAIPPRRVSRDRFAYKFDGCAKVYFEGEGVHWRTIEREKSEHELALRGGEVEARARA